MNPSYNQCSFKLILPEYLEYDDHIKISYKLSYKEKIDEEIIYNNATLKDKLGNTYFDNTPKSFNHSTMAMQSASIIFPHKDKKIWMKHTIFVLTFLSSKGKKIQVTFSFEDNRKGKLLDVTQTAMSKQEELDFSESVKEIENVHVSSYSQSNIEPQIKHDGSESNVSAESIQANEIPGLSEYIKAVNIEKLFLMHEGGRKYKVTNGKLISNNKGVFSYIFELETELHISDDAPIRIEAGMVKASGSVLMCEDFEIIIQLDSNIGERISSAHLTVEPWKLLESLNEKLSSRIALSANSTVKTLIKKGPALATQKPIDLIPKGQEAVINKAMSDPICIVWGPPGTGKTHTMSELAIRFMYEGKKVLIVSHSNVSVDGVAKKIDELMKQKGMISSLKEGKVLRYGYVRDEELGKNEYVSSFRYAASKNPMLNKEIDQLLERFIHIKHTKGLGDREIVDIRKQINRLRAELKEQEAKYVSYASIVATTISKVIIDPIFDEKKYDVVMFDEVSMAYVPHVACAATYAKEHLICVGDFMQLAPIAQSNAKTVLCKDIYTFLGINCNGKPFYHPWLVMLDEQRRMHPKISAFSSKYVYSNLLKDHVSTQTSRNEIVASQLFSREAINLIDLSGCNCAASKDSNNSRYSILSAVISFVIAVKTEPNVRSVSIITPYAAQTRLVRAMELDYRKHRSTEIRCSTVHQFQGSESDVVIFDAVESFPSKRPGWLMGKDLNSILRLINVAVTRARGKLITVANTRFWENHYKGTSHTLYRLLQYLIVKGNIVKHEVNNLKGIEKLVEVLSIEKLIRFYLKQNDYIEQLAKDIRNAKEKIVIALPSGKLDATYEEMIFKLLREKKDQGIQIFIKCNDYKNLPINWKKYALGTENATFPIFMIDDHITWYGVPLAKWEFKDGTTSYLTACPIAFRLEGENTAELIASLADLEYREINGNRTSLSSGAQLTTDNPYGPVGLAAYVLKNKKCQECKNPLEMRKGKSGKTILWCKECKKTFLLTPDDVNHYMCVNHVVCPKHKISMTAKVGQYGLYIKCDYGHYVKPEEI